MGSGYQIWRQLKTFKVKRIWLWSRAFNSFLGNFSLLCMQWRELNSNPCFTVQWTIFNRILIIQLKIKMPASYHAQETSIPIIYSFSRNMDKFVYSISSKPKIRWRCEANPVNSYSTFCYGYFSAHPVVHKAHLPQIVALRNPTLPFLRCSSPTYQIPCPGKTHQDKTYPCP